MVSNIAKGHDRRILHMNRNSKTKAIIYYDTSRQGEALSSRSLSDVTNQLLPNTITP